MSIAWYSKKLENTTFKKLDLFPYSGEGGNTPTPLGPIERLNLNHCTTYINTSDQALSMGGNRKICNKNCDERAET
jgi:hypothetical protein